MHASRQIFRCYTLPEKKKKKGGGGWFMPGGYEADSEIADEINRIGAPWAGPMLLFDRETLTGAKDGQGLRFGCFQERGHRYDWRDADAAAHILTRNKLDTLWHEGIFYEPKNCTPEEIACLKTYAAKYGLDLYTRAEFVKRILYRNHWVKRAANWEDGLRETCYVIGHNVSFDLGAIAIHSGLAKADLYGGLSLVLGGGEHDPNGGFEHRVAVKKIGFGKHLFRGSKQQNGYYVNEFGKRRPRYMEMVHFVDTQTVARALLGPGLSSMKALLKRLDIPPEFQKETADYHGPITPEYIGYCRSDVENTWQIFKGCRELYKRHGRSKPMHKLYSEASLGKAYLVDFWIEGSNKQNPRFDPVVLGCFMEGYYGGRSEVRIRHEIVEVDHNDFRSEYPTGNALMGLQDFVIADRVGVKRDDPEVRRFLETVELDDLQRKDAWKKLRGVALVMPDDDVLPFRTQYGTHEDGSLSVNIGVNRVLSACPAWYIFADIIASKLPTGRTPKILKTLELYPIGKQRTKVIKLFGEDRYTVDLAQGDDLSATLIDARIDVQNELVSELTPEDRKAFLDSFQNGLKLTANGTAYGVLVEFIADDHLEEVPTTVYFGGSSAKVKARLHKVGKDGDQEISDYKVEKAGKYFAPFGALIPAAGRLFLAIAERLAADRGLTYAFDDTDSMAFCDYYKIYSREEFWEKVQEIRGGSNP